jgi:hypothetical protein
MTVGNWLFWGIMTFIITNFLWLGLLEEFIPQWIGALVGFFLFLVLLIYGPREKEEETEE